MTIRQYPYHVIEHSWLPLASGKRLAARIWMPQGAADERLPAVLEYLPYRKRDGTAQRDESTYPVFAAAGIVGVRVDMSGHGEADGDFDDEYSPRELAEGVEVIEWIAAQPWSNGKVGMMGISWGGFNGLQIAAMHPEPLKAVISISSTTDRYNDDIHSKNGCQLYSNFYWSNMMLTYASRPPDPALREDWREVWKHRLQTQPLPLEIWLAHQTRDSYWKHGSVCEDYANYTTPTLIIGGWADLYHNAPVALLENAAGVVKAINGPWIHKYPHFAWPRPRMDFHAEAIRWWNHWLRDDDNAVDALPAYRAYLSEAVKPGGVRLQEPGRWVACDRWPLDARMTWFPTADGSLAETGNGSSTLNIQSPQDCGTACGEMFSLAPVSDLAGDQRADNAGSLVFTSAPLQEAMDLLGRPVLQCEVAIDQPIGNLCVRLIDVHPDGTSYRISWGVLNLTHRNGNEHPNHMQPGEFETVSIRLNECGYRLRAGHRLQLALSTAYWPAILPPPTIVTATIKLGDKTSLELPLADGVNNIDLAEPENENPLPQTIVHSKPVTRRNVDKDLQNGMTHYRVYDDSGETEHPETGLHTRHIRDECWSIKPNDPLSARATGSHTWLTSRENWQVKIECETTMHCDADNYYLNASVKAWLDGAVFNHRTWQSSIPREFS